MKFGLKPYTLIWGGVSSTQLYGLNPKLDLGSEPYKEV